MLSKNELLKIAKIRNIKPFQQEKHYLQTLILNILSDFPLVFKGGTYLWFFHSLDRFSTDLDFTFNLSINDSKYSDVDALSKDIIKVVTERLYLLEGIESNIKVITKNDFSLSLKVKSKGPLYTTKNSFCFVDIDISLREEILEKTIPFSLDFPFYNLPIKIVRCLDLKEVLAEKIRAIYTRKKGRDIYDIYFLISRKKLIIDKEIIKLVNIKLKYNNKEKLTFNIKTFKERINSLEDYFIKDMYEINFSEIKKFNFYSEYIFNNIFL